MRKNISTGPDNTVDLMIWVYNKAVTLLEKRHRGFASKDLIRIRVTVFWLSPSGSSKQTVTKTNVKYQYIEGKLCEKLMSVEEI